MKACSICGVSKPLDAFNKDNRSMRTSRNGQGVSSQCKRCLSERRKPGLEAHRIASAELSQHATKRCGKCKAVKPIIDFHKRVASTDGLAYKCTPCVNSDSHNWRERHPGAHAEWYRQNYAHKAQYFKTWREKNKASIAIKMAEWAKKNPGKINANIAKRNAAKFQATPKWANLSRIEQIYVEAARLRAETGQHYEVDHVVPLQGRTVCGLHWEGNLQILLEAENISKLNRRWPGMAT